VRESPARRAVKLRIKVFNPALLARYTSQPPVSLLATLPRPEDITAAVPFGGTKSISVSSARIGLRVLVTITRTNSSVEIWAIVSVGSLATPALTNSRSN